MSARLSRRTFLAVAGAATVGTGVAAKGAALRGVVVDLRNNPGGLLNQSVIVADGGRPVAVDALVVLIQD